MKLIIELIGYLTNGYPKNMTGIIDSQTEVGGFPTLKTYNIPTDTDLGWNGR